MVLEGESDQNRTGNDMLLQNNRHPLIGSGELVFIDYGGGWAYHPNPDPGKNHVSEKTEIDDEDAVAGKEKAGSSTSNTNEVALTVPNEGSKIVEGEVKPKSGIQEITRALIGPTLSGGIALANTDKTGLVYWLACGAIAIGFLSFLAAFLMEDKYPKLAAYAAYVGIIGASLGFLGSFKA